MFQTKEAIYYYFKGFENLQQQDVDDMVSLIKIIKESGTKERYQVAQELYEILVYTRNYVYIEPTNNVPMPDISHFIGNYGMVHEWDNMFENYNEHILHEILNSRKNDRGRYLHDVNEQIKRFEDAYNKFKVLTGREVVVAIVRNIHKEQVSVSLKGLLKGYDINYLSSDFGEGITPEEAYGKDNWKPFMEKAQQNIRTSWSIWGIDYYSRVIEGIENRNYYHMSYILEQYNKGNLENDLGKKVVLMLDGLLYNMRLKQMMRDS